MLFVNKRLFISMQKKSKKKYYICYNHILDLYYIFKKLKLNIAEEIEEESTFNALINALPVPDTRHMLPIIKTIKSSIHKLLFTKLSRIIYDKKSYNSRCLY